MLYRVIEDFQLTFCWLNHVMPELGRNNSVAAAGFFALGSLGWMVLLGSGHKSDSIRVAPRIFNLLLLQLLFTHPAGNASKGKVL